MHCQVLRAAAIVVSADVVAKKHASRYKTLLRCACAALGCEIKRRSHGGTDAHVPRHIEGCVMVLTHRSHVRIPALFWC